MTDIFSPLRLPGYSLVKSELEKLDISEIQLGSNKDNYNARDNPKFRDDLVCNTLLPKLSKEFNNNATVLRKTLVEVVLDSDIKFYDESSDLVVANREFIVSRYVKNLFNQQRRTYNKNIANGEDQVPEEEVPEVPRQNNHPEPQPQPVYPSYPSSSAHPGPARQYNRRQGFYGNQQFPYQSQEVDSYYDPMDLYYNTQNLLHSSVSMPVFHPMQQQMYPPQQHMYPPYHQGNSHMYPPHQQHMHPPHQGQSWSQAQEIAMGSNNIDQGPRQRLPNLEPQVLHDETLGGELLDALSLSNRSVASGSILSIDSLGLGQQSVSSFAGLLSIDTFVPSEAGSIGEAHDHMVFDLEG